MVAAWLEREAVPLWTMHRRTAWLPAKLLGLPKRNRGELVGPRGRQATPPMLSTGTPPTSRTPAPRAPRTPTSSPASPRPVPSERTGRGRARLQARTTAPSTSSGRTPDERVWRERLAIWREVEPCSEPPAAFGEEVLADEPPPARTRPQRADLWCCSYTVGQEQMWTPPMVATVACAEHRQPTRADVTRVQKAAGGQ
jgi:hypothetical protein